MTHPSAQELLGVPLFDGLDAAAAEVLAQRFDVEQYDEGRRIVLEGSSGYAFYVIADGQARVSQEGSELRSLGSGDFFGEIAILGGGRRTATVTAAAPLTAWKMFGTSFREMETTHPEVAAALVAAMRQRLAAG